MLGWSRQYLTGIDSVDTQHKTLFRLMERLVHILGSEETRLRGVSVELDDIFDELLEYTKTHFDHEEDLMRRAQFSGYNSHREVHQDFTSMIRMIAQTNPEPLILLFTIRDWVVKHLMGEDRKYISALISLMDEEGRELQV